jgi:V8-like Glu-specific endopeptidase
MRGRSARGRYVVRPMLPADARAKWPRDKIKTFAFPQPVGPTRHLVSRDAIDATAVLSTTPQMPEIGDISAVPSGQRQDFRFEFVKTLAAPLRTYWPDGRRVFSDTTYPWRCCGRVITPAGSASGALVGPRHLLTVSHVIDWQETEGHLGWLRFEPGYFDGHRFPAANAVQIYAFERITATSVDAYDIAADYVVCVLDRDVGDELGWFGATSYDSSWDEYRYWSHVGYPIDLGGGTRPAFEGPVSVKNSWHPGFFETGFGKNLLTRANTSHGNSGGPFFGWWETGPHIVGVICASGSLSPVLSHPFPRIGNWVGGGSPLPVLVNLARIEFP